MLGMPPASGKPRLRLPKEGPGKAAGTGARAPGWWGSWEPPPGVSAYGGEGVDRAPLAVLLGVGARALWMAGEIPGGLGPPQIRAPPLLVGASQHVTRGPPTGLHSAGTSPELTEPETSGHNIQPQVLTGASPVSVNSAPLGRLPRMTRESEPHCLVGGGLLPTASAPPTPPPPRARPEGKAGRLANSLGLRHHFLE